MHSPTHQNQREKTDKGQWMPVIKKERKNLLMILVFPISLLVFFLIAYFSLTGFTRDWFLRVKTSDSSLSLNYFRVYASSLHKITTIEYQEVVSAMNMINNLCRKSFNDEVKISTDSKYTIMKVTDMDNRTDNGSLLSLVSKEDRDLKYYQYNSWYKIDFTENFTYYHNKTMTILKPILTQFLLRNNFMLIENDLFYTGFQDLGYFIAYPIWNSRLKFENPNTRPADCNYPRPSDSVFYYDPRCRPWWRQSLDIDGVSFIEPYLGPDETLDTTFCARNVNTTSRGLLIISCVDLKMSRFQKQISNSIIPFVDPFLVIPKSRKSILHPKMNVTTSQNMIEDIEVGDDPVEKNAYLDMIKIFSQPDYNMSEQEIEFLRKGQKIISILKPIVLYSKNHTWAENDEIYPYFYMLQGSTISSANLTTFSENINTDINSFETECINYFVVIFFASLVFVAIAGYLVIRNYRENYSKINEILEEYISKNNNEKLMKHTVIKRLESTFKVIDNLKNHSNNFDESLSKEPKNEDVSLLIKKARSHYNPFLGRKIIRKALLENLINSQYYQVEILIKILEELSKNCDTTKGKKKYGFYFSSASFFSCEYYFNGVIKYFISRQEKTIAGLFANPPENIITTLQDLNRKYSNLKIQFAEDVETDFHLCFVLSIINLILNFKTEAEPFIKAMRTAIEKNYKNFKFYNGFLAHQCKYLVDGIYYYGNYMLERKEEHLNAAKACFLKSITGGKDSTNEKRCANPNFQYISFDYLKNLYQIIGDMSNKASAIAEAQKLKLELIEFYYFTDEESIREPLAEPIGANNIEIRL